MSTKTSTVETPLLAVSVTQFGTGSPVVYLHDVLFDLVRWESPLPRVLDLLSASRSIVRARFAGIQ